MALARRLERAAARDRASTAALDRLDIGVFCVDRDARLLHANHAGAAMLRDGEGLALVRG